MNKKILLLVALLGFWVLVVLAGYCIAHWGESLLGTRTMLVAASILSTLTVVMLIGQFLAGTSDYFLSIDNPRPLDDHEANITSTAWGFASETSRSAKAEVAGEGFADIRLSAKRSQVLTSLFSFGFLRPVSIVWRGNAGQHPLGDA